ncbi:MAG: hypothetical protein EAZ37_17230 [Burkholderiales bacterium]|nr:MAG: hypothetical protein EAZ43_09785 [Betaproteobacteria bacterium]TAG24054.1 MAG: hypothetical protein EAZ37_17230 [Burkholderiales bacterium]
MSVLTFERFATSMRTALYPSNCCGLGLLRCPCRRNTLEQEARRAVALIASMLWLISPRAGRPERLVQTQHAPRERGAKMLDQPRHR